MTQPADVALYVHESTINNVAETVLTGMRLNDAMVQHAAVELLGRLPAQLQPDQEPFTVIFPPDGERTPPVTVSFGNDGLTVTLRGKEYIANDRTQPGMDVTAAYKFVKTAEGYKAVRQGELQIYGFGQTPGAKRSFRQEGIYVVLQRKFGKLFAAEIKLQGFTFNQGKLATAGRMAPREIISQNGWLAIGYRREAMRRADRGGAGCVRAALRAGESITGAWLPFAPRKPHLLRSERRRFIDSPVPYSSCKVKPSTASVASANFPAVTAS